MLGYFLRWTAGIHLDEWIRSIEQETLSRTRPGNSQLDQNGQMRISSEKTSIVTLGDWDSNNIWIDWWYTVHVHDLNENVSFCTVNAMKIVFLKMEEKNNVVEDNHTRI